MFSDERDKKHMANISWTPFEFLEKLKMQVKVIEGDNMEITKNIKDDE